MAVRNEIEGVEPMDALHATVHVTCKDWRSFARRLLGPATTSEVLAAELTRRSFGAGRVWTAIRDDAR
jgi:hypothetical protein